VNLEDELLATTKESNRESVTYTTLSKT